MKSTLLYLVFFCCTLLIGNVAVANIPANRQKNRNVEEEFCQNFPLNKECAKFISEDMETFCIDHPLDKRCEEKERLLSQQDSFFCSLMPNLKQSSHCKVLVKNEQIIAYLEPNDASNSEQERREIVISKQDIFSFHSQWWLAGVGDRQNSAGMFTEIQIGYLLNNPQEENKSNFLTISAEAILPTNLYLVKGFSNENMPKIVEKLEPWLYHNPDIATLAPLFKPKFNNTNTQVSQNIKRLLDTKECPRCNLAGADLSGTTLAGANLEGTNLEGTNLEGADLRKAYLIGADLNNANLYEANLGNSILMSSSLENSDLEGANLQAANIKFANLNNANLTQARLNADGLNITQLQNASLINADLTEANLSCANLDSANLKNADLTRANVKSCAPKIPIKKGDISSFLLNKAKISTPLSDLKDGLSVISSALAIFSSMSGSGNNTGSLSNLENLEMRSLDFVGYTNLSNANLNGANLAEANLDSANLFNSNLSNAILNSVDLQDTDLSNSNLIESQINNSELEKAFLCNTIMPNFSIERSGCINSE